jgi:hypothetical protein
VIDEHATAILALLDADNAPPALVVLDGKVPNGVVPPYVLVYFADNDPELADSTPLTGRSERYVLRAYCHSVGGSGQAARMVADRVRTALLDVTPTVTGRSCWAIRREDGQPTQRDESTGTPVMDKIDVYRIESVPG